MRQAAMLVFVLLAVAILTAQTPAGTASATPQTQTPPHGATAPPGTAEDSQKSVSQSPSTGTTGSQQPANPSGVQTAPPGQEAASGAVPAAVVDQLAAGTELRATLDTPLSTKTSKPGDRFTATVAEPARGSGGAVVIPPGTRVEGEVAEPEESQALEALREKGALSLRFRDLVLPGGQTLPMTATLISVNDTTGKSTKKTDEEGHVQSGTGNKDIAKDTVVRNSAGPAFGGPLKGLAIGAQSGGGYVLAVKGKDVRLPAQTGMVIRLDQPVSANAAPQPPQ